MAALTPTMDDFQRLEAKIDKLETLLLSAINIILENHNAREYTRKQAAEKLGVSLRQLDYLKSSGAIGFFRAGKIVKFTQAHLDEYRKRRNVPALKVR